MFCEPRLDALYHCPLDATYLLTLCVLTQPRQTHHLRRAPLSPARARRPDRLHIAFRRTFASPLVPSKESGTYHATELQAGRRQWCNDQQLVLGRPQSDCGDRLEAGR